MNSLSMTREECEMTGFPEHEEWPGQMTFL